MARRIVTAREQAEMLAPWRAAAYYTEDDFRHGGPDPSTRPVVVHPDGRRQELRDWVREAKLPKTQKCEYCKDQAEHRILHSEGMAYTPVCDKHLAKGKDAAEHCTPDGTRDPSNIVRVDKIAQQWPYRHEETRDWGMPIFTHNIGDEWTHIYKEMGPLLREKYEKLLDDEEGDYEDFEVPERQHPFYRQNMKSIEPTMNVPRQTRKFDIRSEQARAQGDHELADYIDNLKAQMLQGVDQGQPQAFSTWWPMALEEFDDRAERLGAKRFGGLEENDPLWELLGLPPGGTRPHVPPPPKVAQPRDPDRYYKHLLDQPDDTDSAHVWLPTDVVEHYREYVPGDPRYPNLYGPQDNNYQAVKRAISEHGVRQPLWISANDTHGMLVEGNNRLQVAKELGIDTLPVRVTHDNPVLRNEGRDPAPHHPIMGDWFAANKHRLKSTFD